MEDLNKSVYPEKISYGNQIVVATNCLYKDYRNLSDEQREPGDTDGIRGDLALELIAKTLSSGVRIVVSDGGSSPEFHAALDKLTSEGLIVIDSDEIGRGPQRRKAFETATLLPSSRVIVYTQSEKVSLVNHLVEISQPILEGNADIVIPKRNPELFEQSYPDYMRESELRVNKTYNWLMHKAKLLGKDQSLDWFFGPVVFRNDPEIVALFLKRYELNGVRSRAGAILDPEMHSDGHYFPIIEALFLQKRVASVEVPFVYPPMQRANEMSPQKIEDFKRRRLLDGAAYRLEALHFLAYLRGNKKSLIREIKSA